MKSSNFIDKYLNMAEQSYSNAVGYRNPSDRDSAYDDMHVYGMDGIMEGMYNGQPSYYYANGAATAGTAVVGAPISVPVVPAKQPTPYQVNVSNTTGSNLTVTLFGYNTFLLTTNFGSSVGVTVTPAQVNISYLELLSQSASQPFETSLIRVQTSNAAQLTQILTVTSKDANGQLCQIPIITQSYFSANQFQSTILDIPYPVKIDGNTNISFTILANTTATYTFFPSEKVNNTRILGGGSELQTYAPPAVPVAVPMFTAQPMGLQAPTLVPATVR